MTNLLETILWIIFALLIVATGTQAAATYFAWKATKVFDD